MRWILAVASALVTLLVIGALALLLVPAETVAGLAAQRLSAATGRAVEIEGPVRVSVWPAPGVRTGPVRIAGADWSETPDRPMLAASALRISLDAAALATGRLRLAGFEADAAELLIERHRDGRLNWALSPPAAAASTGAGAPSAATGEPDWVDAIDRLRITDGTVEFRDHASGARHRLDGLALELADLSGPATLTAAGRLDGQPLSLTARLGSPAALAAGQTSAVEVRLEGAGLAAAFEGQAAAAPPAADGRLEMRAEATAMGRAMLQGVVALRPDRVGLSDGHLSLGDNRLALAGDLDLTGARPRLTGRATAQALDLTGPAGGAAPGTAGERGTSAGAAGWSTARIDASALHLLDADVAVAAQSVSLDALRLGPLRGHLSLDAGRAVLRLDEAAAFEGQVTGQLVANARGRFSARADLGFTGLQAETVLGTLAGWDRVSGRLGGEVALLGVGDSVAALMASLSGDGRLDLGPGTVRGLDLGALLSTGDPRHLGSDRRTAFDGVTASFVVRDGVLRNEDLRMRAPTLTADGAGRVDIGAQTLDYRVTAALREGPPALQRLRLPVTVRGTWADPAVSVDLEALVRQQVEERARDEAARLEREARDEAARLEREARERLQRELDRRIPVPPGLRGDSGRQSQTRPDAAPDRPPGVSPEEALRRRLEQEVGRGLGRLLRGD